VIARDDRSLFRQSVDDLRLAYAVEKNLEPRETTVSKLIRRLGLEPSLLAILGADKAEPVASSKPFTVPVTRIEAYPLRASVRAPVNSGRALGPAAHNCMRGTGRLASMRSARAHSVTRRTSLL
jgi:hypothetical protein